jgi:formate hydrogenlyase subunit 6/NADH:ubiquinone oxidoreductase subunit I
VLKDEAKIFHSKGGDLVAFKITDECVACGTCAEECPSDAINEGDDIYMIDQEACTECGTCKDVCPTEAIIEE